MKHWLRITSLGLIALIIVITASVTLAADALKFTSVNAALNDEKGAAVTVTFDINRGAQAGETIGVKIYNSAGLLLAGPTDLTSGLGTHGTMITSGADGTYKVDQTLVVQMIDTINGKTQIVATTRVGVRPVPVATPPPTATTDCLKFDHTIFGDNLCASEYFAKMYSWAVTGALLVSVIMIIYAGYRYIMSRGDPAVTKNAREIITNTLVAIALLLLSYTILRFLGINVVSP